jgi:DNA-binding transcriptional LysR family regulator
MALRVDAVMDDLRLTFGSDREASTVKLRLGAIETVAAHHLPGVVAAFVRQHPNVDVSIQTGSSLSLIKQIREGVLDVAFVSRRFDVPALRERPAFRDELVLVAPKGAESLAALVASSGPALKILVQRLGCSYTDRLLKLLEQKGRHSHRLLELGTLDGIIGFVEAGIGIAVMPRGFAGSLTATRSVELLPLPRELRRADTYLVAPPSDESSRIVNDFVGSIVAARK